MNKLKFFKGKIEIDPMAVFIITLLVAIDKTKLIGIFIFSSILHETGHLIAIKLLNGRINKVVFEPFSLTVEKPYTKTGIKTDLVISISGILSNLLFFCLSFCVYKITKIEFFLYFSFAHVFVGAYNLLPLCYLDGGELITIAEKLVFKENSRGITPFVFHIITVIAGIIISYKLLQEHMYLESLMCLYPLILTPVNRIRTVKRGGRKGEGLQHSQNIFGIKKKRFFHNT